jgi:hypothetical protein
LPVDWLLKVQQAIFQSYSGWEKFVNKKSERGDSGMGQHGQRFNTGTCFSVSSDDKLVLFLFPRNFRIWAIQFYTPVKIRAYYGIPLFVRIMAQLFILSYSDAVSFKEFSCCLEVVFLIVSHSQFWDLKLKELSWFLCYTLCCHWIKINLRNAPLNTVISHVKS